MANFWDGAPIVQNKDTATDSGDWWQQSSPMSDYSNSKFYKISEPFENGDRLYYYKIDGRDGAVRAKNYDDALALSSPESRQRSAEHQVEPDQRYYESQTSPLKAAVNGLASGISFGFDDNVAGALNSVPSLIEAANPWGDTTFEDIKKSYVRGREDYRDAQDTAKKAYPKLFAGSELAGSIVPVVGAAGSGATLAGRLGTSELKGLTGTAARAAMVAPEMAGYSALDALGHGEDIKQAAITGAVGGALGNAASEKLITPAANKFLDVFNKKPAIPSLEEVRNKASDLYKSLDNSKDIFTKDATQRILNDSIKDATELGYSKRLHPKVTGVLDELKDASDENHTVKGMEILRRIASNATDTQDRSERKILSAIIDNIDKVTTNPTANEVTGDVAPVINNLSSARKLWQQSSKAQEVLHALDRAENARGSSGSGGNLENTTRQKLKSILETGRGYTSDETDALRELVRGNFTRNTLRHLGKFSPSTGALPAISGVGSLLGAIYTGHPEIAAIPAIGLAAKSLSDWQTNKSISNLLNIILAGGSKSATQVQPNALQQLLLKSSPALDYSAAAIGSRLPKTLN